MWRIGHYSSDLGESHRSGELGRLMQRKILIMGLPGAGKTTLASVLAPLLNAVVSNWNEVARLILSWCRRRPDTQ